MTRSKVEKLIPIEETYRVLMDAAVTKIGGQVEAAKKLGIHQTTVSRALAKNGKATYQTLEKFSSVFALPHPIVSVRDAAHEEWCRLGAELEREAPDKFQTRLTDLRRDVRDLPDGDEARSAGAIGNLKSVITHPLPNKVKKIDRRA